MSRVSFIREPNELLQRDDGLDKAIEDPITVRDLAIIVQALKQGKKHRR